jgi:tetratricopeptide (TPR) repeat protein
MTGNFSETGLATGEKPAVFKPETQLQMPTVPPTAARNAKFMPEGKERVMDKPEPRPSCESRLKEGIRLFNLEKWDEALGEFLLVDLGDLSAGDRIELSYYKGLCHTKLGKPEDAVPFLEEVISSGGDMLRIYQCRMALAYIHITAGRFKLAEFEMKRLLDSGFESTQMLNTMAYAAYARKHYRHAIQYYEKSLKLDENNPTALNSMGYILVDAGIDPLKGLRYCRQAVEIKPDSATYLDSLGWACYKCSDPTAAKSWLKKALEIAPKEKTIKEHLRIVSGGTA